MVGGEEGSKVGGAQGSMAGAAPNAYNPHPYAARPGLGGLREPTPAAAIAEPGAALSGSPAAAFDPNLSGVAGLGSPREPTPAAAIAEPGAASSGSSAAWPTPAAAAAAVPAAKKKKKANLKPAAKQYAHMSQATLSEHKITISRSDQMCTFSHKPKDDVQVKNKRLEPGLDLLRPLRRS